MLEFCDGGSLRDALDSAAFTTGVGARMTRKVEDRLRTGMSGVGVWVLAANAQGPVQGA